MRRSHCLRARNAWALLQVDWTAGSGAAAAAEDGGPSQTLRQQGSQDDAAPATAAQEPKVEQASVGPGQPEAPQPGASQAPAATPAEEQPPPAPQPPPPASQPQPPPLQASAPLEAALAAVAGEVRGHLPPQPRKRQRQDTPAPVAEFLEAVQAAQTTAEPSRGPPVGAAAQPAPSEGAEGSVGPSAASSEAAGAPSSTGGMTSLPVLESQRVLTSCCLGQLASSLPPESVLCFPLPLAAIGDPWQP